MKSLFYLWDMNATQTIQAKVTIYNKVYTITFETGAGLDNWVKESRYPEAYGGRKAFVELTTTRDAQLFGIVDCTKA